MKKQPEDLSLKMQTTIQPVFVSCTIDQELKVQETKPLIVNQQCVVYRFQCDLCDAGYLGYTRRHLHERVERHKHQLSAISKHYNSIHGKVLEDLLRSFVVLRKCTNTFDCLVHEMLLKRHLIPNLNVQSDSIRAKVFGNFHFCTLCYVSLAPTLL